MVLVRVTRFFAVSVGILTLFSSYSVAENTWNIVTSEAADSLSREAGSELIDGTILVLDALRSAEKRRYQVSEQQLRAAAQQYEVAALLLDELAGLEASLISLNIGSLNETELAGLGTWYETFLSNPFEAVETNQSPFHFQNDDFVAANRAIELLSSLTASDLLKVAALHCRAIAEVLLSPEDERGIPETRAVSPTRLSILTTQASLIIIVGNIATQVFQTDQ